MRKIFTFLFAMLCLFSGYLQAQQFQVTGCSGTLGSNLYGPMYSIATDSATSRTAVIYPSSQLTGISGVPLTTLYLNRFTATGSMAGTPNFKIYLKEVAAADWGATALDWATAITGATLVYDGDPAAIVGTTAGWKAFPLIANYNYSGSQNLALFTEYTNATASTAITWVYEYTAPCISTTNNNTTKYSNNTTGTLPTSLASTNYRRPYLGFDLFLSCNTPTGLTASNTTVSSADISWTAPSPAPPAGYEYYYNTSGTAPTAATAPTGTTGAGVTTAAITGLPAAGTLHYFWVRSVCSTTEKSPWTAGPAFATKPTNDECAGAISLTQSATCTNTAGSTVGATLSMAATPCNGNPDDDVWFSFEATATDAQITISGVTAVVGTSTDTYFQVLSGSCGSLASMMCTDPLSGIVGGLTPGDTYYIRVYMYGAGTAANFNICVNELAAAPATCATLSAPAAAAQVSTAPTLSWATVANASAYDIYLDGNNPPSTLYATVYNNSRLTYTVDPPLAAGDYYWYVVPKNSLGEATGCETNARLFTATQPPVNDDCASAIVLTAAASNTCTGVAGSTVGATASTETAPTCSATGVNDDVWYSFVATSASHSVVLTGTTSTCAAAIYSGTCGSLVQVACASTTATATGLTVGQTYYVRVYTTVATATTTSVFNICVVTPPANDDCAGASAMPITDFGSACINTSVNTTGASISSLTGQGNSCTTTGIDDDVWYTFTTASAGVYTFSYSSLVAVTGTASTLGMNLYTGTCGTFTEVASSCSSGYGSGGAGTRSLTLAAATTYTLRLFVGSSINSGTFNFCITAPAATPVNDECAGAIALPVPSSTFSCTTPLAGTTNSATQSANAAPTCSATGINDDVWYSFVATATAHTVIISGATNTAAAVLYTGTCGSLTAIGCATGGAAASGLTIGSTYYVRVYTTTSTATTFATFNICVVSGAPANDECSAAIALPAPSTTNSCSTTTSGSTTGATTSSDAAPSCSATGINDDVWYSFVASSAAHAVVFSSASSATAAAIYSGTCGSLTQITGACGSSPDGSALATSLTPGSTYYVRIYTTSTVVGTYSDFNFCIISVPANDDCSSAQALTVSADCSGSASGSTAGATASTGETAPTCSPTGVNDDVWYSFVATATSHTVSLFNTTTTTAASVYSGSCGSLVAVSCASTNTVAAALTPGNTYYVRVYSTSTVAGTYGTFDICIGGIPSNDDCAGAISLPASTSCNPVAGTTTGATATTGETAPTCSATGVNDDVWYSFTATAATHIVSITNASTTTAAAIYSGSCGSLVQVACASTTATATGLTIGNLYYVRVYSTVSTAGTYSNFNICVAGIPANDNCAAAVPLTSAVTVNGSIIAATETMPAEICGTATAAPAALDVWYQFTTVSGGAAVINVTNVASTLDAVVQVYSGTCGAFTNIGCADGPSVGGSETVTLNGLTPGTTYFVRVYGFTTGVGAFSITVSGAALPIAVEYFKGSRKTAGNSIEWKMNCDQSSNTDMLLERSSDGRNFNVVYSVTASASRCLTPFSYTDIAPFKGVNYYRLRSKDIDGKLTYSKTIALVNNEKGMEIVNMLPNPVHQKATLNIFSAAASSMEIVITDIAGRKISTQSVTLVAGTNQVQLNCYHLASGMYTLRGYTLDGETKTIKFIKE